jgi:hypothetical protein
VDAVRAHVRSRENGFFDLWMRTEQGEGVIRAHIRPLLDVVRVRIPIAWMHVSMGTA